MKKSELIASVVGIAKANGYTMTEEQIGLLSKLTVKRIHERFCLLVWGHFGALTATDIEGFEYEAGAVRDRIAELKAKEV